METKKVYVPIIIKTEADLPKEGKFWIHQKIYEDSLLNIFDFSTPHRKLWEKDIDWYLLPVDLPTDEEINEYVFKLLPTCILRGLEDAGDVNEDCRKSVIDALKWLRDKLLNR